MLNRRNFTSHAVGKWHLGFHQAAYTPTERGYDRFFGILTGGLVAIAPSRREDILQLAPRALISGTLATLMTGAAVGALPQGLFG